MSAAEPKVVPENRPAPLDALTLEETPDPLHYRRNHFAYPAVDRDNWVLEIGGAVDCPQTFSLDALRELPRHEVTTVLECAGHRRTEDDPPVSGVAWGIGALSQARWSGTPLAAVLARAGLRRGVVEIVFYGRDRGEFKGLEGSHPFARGLPRDKALHGDTLLAWEMNAAPLPEAHGAPLRAVVPGWYAMDSVKWITRIEAVTEPFRGPFQELDYRFQAADDPGIGRRLTAIPVHSLILAPTTGAAVAPGRHSVHGIAWGGTGGVRSIELRLDNGPWLPVAFEPPSGPYRRLVWKSEYDAPPRDHVLSVRATDGSGCTQPDQPTWNRRGYANNSIQRVSLRSA